MLYVTVGATGFLSVVFYDLAQLRGRKGIATVVSSIGYLCILASIVFPIVSVGLPKLSGLPLVVKVLPVSLFLLLLIYSALVEIPLGLRGRPLDWRQSRRVVSAGFYGIVRHPGLVWFVLLWASIAVLCADPLVTKVGAGLVAADFALVVAEDLYFFPRIFVDYDDYKKRVPFLIPRLRR